MKRLPEIEADAFTHYGISAQGVQCGSALAMVATVQGDGFLSSLARYEATLRKSAFKHLGFLADMRKGKWGADASAMDAQAIEGAAAPSEKTSATGESGASIAGSVPTDVLGSGSQPEG